MTVPRLVYRVETQRLVLRCWTPEDAPLWRALLDESDDYFRPFVPWMRDEPVSLEDTAGRLRKKQEDFVSGKNYRYGILDRDEKVVIGETGLYTRVGPGAREVGYMIGRPFAGRGYASEAAAAMIKVGFENDKVDRIELHCSPHNHASIHIAEKLGFKHKKTLPAGFEDSEGTPHDSMIWLMSAADYLGSPPGEIEIAAYGESGERIM